MTHDARQLPPSRRILLFSDSYGAPLSLEYLPHDRICGIIAASNRPGGHEALRSIAGSLNVPFLVQPSFGAQAYESFARALSALQPDLLLCNSYSMLIRPDILRLVRMAVNVHGGILPEYRGANPIQWAIINGERQAGATMHLMDASFDTGAIIDKIHVPIPYDATWLDVFADVGTAISRLLERNIANLLEGRIGADLQEGAAARHYRRRRPEDGLLDFSRSTRVIYNMIRALVSPLPGAFYIDQNDNRESITSYRSLHEVLGIKQANAPLACGAVPVGVVNDNNKTRLCFSACREDVVELEGILDPGGIARWSCREDAWNEKEMERVVTIFCREELEFVGPIMRQRV